MKVSRHSQSFRLLFGNETRLRADTPTKQIHPGIPMFAKPRADARNHLSAQSFTLNDWQVNPSRNEIQKGSKIDRIEPLAMDVLVYLVQRRGHVVSTSELLSVIWNDRPLHSAAVKKRINQLRRALGDNHADPKFIATIPKRGYTLVAASFLASNTALINTRPERAVETRALQSYLRGMATIGVSDNFSTWSDQVKKHLELAVAQDDSFADAWAALSLIATIEGVWTDRSAFADARKYARRTLELVGNHPVGFTTLGYLFLLEDWNAEEALKSFEQALASSPYDPRALRGHMTCLQVLGRTRDAEAASQLLVSLAPGERAHAAERIKVLYGARRYTEVVKESEIRRILEPEFCLLEEPMSLVRMGQEREAADSLVRAFQYSGSTGVEDLLGSEFEHVARSLLERHVPNELQHRTLSLLAILGEFDRALALLEIQIASRAPWLVGIYTHPDFDPLRDDLRFKELLKNTGLPVIEVIR